MQGPRLQPRWSGCLEEFVERRPQCPQASQCFANCLVARAGLSPEFTSFKRTHYNDTYFPALSEFYTCFHIVRQRFLNPESEFSSGLRRKTAKVRVSAGAQLVFFGQVCGRRGNPRVFLSCLPKGIPHLLALSDFDTPPCHGPIFWPPHHDPGSFIIVDK